MTSAALDRLTDAFDQPFGSASSANEKDRSCVVTSSPAVPIEIIHAAGLRPLVIRGRSARTPLADAVLEPHIFPNRLRQLVDGALAGLLSRATCVVLPRTSDSDYKVFLYLHELTRRNRMDVRAPVLLFDLLQSSGPDVHAYDTARTHELFGTLAALAGRRATADDVRDAVTRSNLARAARRRLGTLRRGVPRVSGAEMVPLLGAFWQLPPDEYAALAHQAADVLARRQPIDAPRVLLTGAPVDGAALHAAIESHGAVVVAEPGPWGSGSVEADEDVICGDDPFAAIAERYRQCPAGPRTALGSLRRHAAQFRDEVDLVVVTLPPDDAVFGWEYPALRAWLGEQQLPHVCVSVDPCEPLSTADHERLAAAMTAVPSRAGAHRG
jgi:hypothetical protein